MFIHCCNKVFFHSGYIITHPLMISILSIVPIYLLFHDLRGCTSFSAFATCFYYEMSCLFIALLYASYPFLLPTSFTCIILACFNCWSQHISILHPICILANHRLCYVNVWYVFDLKSVILHYCIHHCVLFCVISLSFCFIHSFFVIYVVHMILLCLHVLCHVWIFSID